MQLSTTFSLYFFWSRPSIIQSQGSSTLLGVKINSVLPARSLKMHTVVKVHKVYGRLGDDQLCDIFRSTEQYESGQLAGNDGANHYKNACPNKNTFKRTCSTRNTDWYDHEAACLNNALCNEASTIKRGGGRFKWKKHTQPYCYGLWLSVTCKPLPRTSYIYTACHPCCSLAPNYSQKSLIESLICHLNTVNEYDGLTDRLLSIFYNPDIEEVSGLSAVYTRDFVSPRSVGMPIWASLRYGIGCIHQEEVTT